MSSRLRIRKKITRIETPDISTAPAQGMFQSRPFAVQKHSAEKSQQPDLKTALMRAERYGHHLHKMQPVSLSAPKLVQRKLGNGQQVESETALAHEAWHVVPQKQGGVKPTRQVEDVSINDAHGLEHKVDVMGAKAMQMKRAYQVAAEVPSRRDVGGKNLGKMPLNSRCIQKMKIRGTDQPSEVSSTTKNKHVVAVGDQATKAEEAYGSSTFVTSEAILTSAVNANAHNFTEAANAKSARFDFEANVPIYQWDKTGPRAIPERFAKGEPVSKTIDGQNTTCEIGVVKGGDDKIKVTHFKKK